MAKKAKVIEEPKLCKDCVHCYDWHNTNYLGEFIMAKCKHYQYSVLLNNNCKTGLFSKKIG